MRHFLSKVFFWTYPRGCWQYDLICIVILAFIFLTPPSVLDGSAFRWGDDEAPRQITQPASETKPPDSRQ